MKLDKLSVYAFALMSLLLTLSICFPANIPELVKLSFSENARVNNFFSCSVLKLSNSPIYVIGLRNDTYFKIVKNGTCIVEDLIGFAEIKSFKVGRGFVTVYSNSCILLVPGLNGSCWFPSTTGSYVGRKFVFTPMSHGVSSITLVVVALENSVVRVYDASGKIVISSTYVRAFFYRLIDLYPGNKLKPGEAYIIESTGDILVGCVGELCFNYAISPRGKFIDTELYGLALSSPPCKIAGFEIYSFYDDTVVNVSDPISGTTWTVRVDELSSCVIYNTSINGHLLKFKSNKPIVAIVFTATELTQIPIGSVYLNSNGVGKRFIFKLHSELSKAIIYTGNCGWVRVNTEIRKPRNHVLVLNGTGIYYVEAPMEISIQIIDGYFPLDAGAVISQTDAKFRSIFIDENVEDILSDYNKMLELTHLCKSHGINMLFLTFSQNLTKAIYDSGFKLSLLAREIGVSIVVCTPKNLQLKWCENNSENFHDEVFIEWLENVIEVNSMFPSRSFTGVLIWIEIDNLPQWSEDYSSRLALCTALLNLTEKLREVCRLAGLELFITCPSSVLRTSLTITFNDVQNSFIGHLAYIADYIVLLEKTDNPIRVVKDIYQISNIINAYACELIVTLSVEKSENLTETLYDDGLQAVSASINIINSLTSNISLFKGILIESLRDYETLGMPLYNDLVLSHAPTLVYDSLEKLYPTSPYAFHSRTVYFYMVNLDKFYVIEYWLYYQMDEFNVSMLSHEHDIEFIFLWIDKRSLELVYMATSYHNWIHLYTRPRNIKLYVERGSHSMAANMNQLLACDGKGEILQLSEFKFLPLQCLLVNLTDDLQSLDYLKSSVGIPLVRHPWTYSFTENPSIDAVRKLNVSLSDVSHRIASLKLSLRIHGLFDLTVKTGDTTLIISDLNDSLAMHNMIYSNGELFIMYPGERVTITLHTLEQQTVSMLLTYESHNLSRKLIIEDIPLGERCLLSIEFTLRSLYHEEKAFKISSDVNGDGVIDFTLDEDYRLDKNEFLWALEGVSYILLTISIVAIIAFAMAAIAIILRKRKIKMLRVSSPYCPRCGEPLIYLKFRNRLYCPRCNRYFKTTHGKPRG